MTKRTTSLLAICLVFRAVDAYAQEIPLIVLPLAASPIVAIILSAVLGAMTRSWRIALGSTGLTILWVVWFTGASMYVTSDLIIWAPIAGLGLHLVALLCFIVMRAVRRMKAHNVA
jgi:hypothetical protein